MQIGSTHFGRKVLGLLLVLGCSTFFSSQLTAQTNTTALTGTVTDATGALMPNVAISISNMADGAAQNEKTHSKGEYSFEQLKPGTYVVKVSSAGFSEQEQQVELLVATPLKLNFKLTVGSSEVVNVETTAATINSTDATLGKAFDSKQIQTLPYLANNVTYLLSLQPGVLALDSGAQTGGLNTDTRTGIVNGARQDQTNITLDGVDNNDGTNGYAFNGALRTTRESVQEFRVTTTNGNADAGRSSGGQVSLVTRAGTNAIHGSGYEYYRSSVGAQNNWFTKQTALVGSKPNIPLKILQHTYGASLGGPLLKDKLFLFGAYEGFKQASSQLVNQTVPSILGGGGLASGNVTYAVCPTKAACASSTTYKTLTRTDIATMDPNCLANKTCAKPGTNDAIISYFNSFPTANSTSTGDGVNTGTYSFSSPVPLHQITNIVRMDYNLSPRQSLFGRGNLQSDNQALALQFPGNPPSQNIFSNNKGLAGGHIWTINNSMTNNFRYGFVRQGVANRGSASQPYVTVAGISSITATGTTATTQVYAVTTNNFADDFTYSKGRHTLQFGMNDRILSNQRYFDSPLLSTASISTALLGSAAIAGTNSSLDPQAFACPNCGTVAGTFKTFYNAAILANTGIVESASSGTEYKIQNNSLVPAGTGVVPTHTYRNLEQEYYFQDQWKATSHLTITAGLRYVYLGTPYEINGQQIAPSISMNTFLQNRIAAMSAGTNYNTRISFRTAGSPNGQPNFWTPQKSNFAPRLAFAYASSNNKTVLRGGFALAYDHIGEGIIGNYESSSSSLFSLSKSNTVTYPNVDTNPRFTGYHDVYLQATTPATIPLPSAPADNPFTFLNTINDNIKTPYAETFNLSVQHEMKSGITLTASYVGRLGRHVLSSIDVAQPMNLTDTVSGQSYYAAAQAYDKAFDAGASVASMPDSGYFHNMYPNLVYTDPTTKIAYKGAQGYYAAFAANRGNETNPLFACDSELAGFQLKGLVCGASAAQAFRFFYPQTSSIFAQSTIGSSNYNALQLSMRHVLRYGLTYDVNYTYAKSMDQGSSPERSGSGSNRYINTFNPSGMYSVSDFDVRHNITANYSAPLPFGRGRPFLNSTHGFVDALLGGWQLNGVVHYSTAFPFSANASGNYGTNFSSSSNMVKIGDIATGGHNWIAPTSATVPGYETALKGLTATQATAKLRLAYVGETGQRNAFRADGYFSMDDGFSKSFKTFREQSFSLKVEVFNVTGSPRFDISATNKNGLSTNFGRYTSLLTQPRQMQFSGKYTF